jgi:hypothetical protein
MVQDVTQAVAEAGNRQELVMPEGQVELAVVVAVVELQ